MEDIIKEFFGQQKPPIGQPRDSFFEKYGLEHNPFPPNRMIFEDILYGQPDAFSRFLLASREILLSQKPQRRALGVMAGVGGGKTHFLRHCQYKFRAVCAKTDRTFAITEFTAGSGKLIDLVRKIYEDAEHACRKHHEVDLLSAIIRKLSKHPKSNTIIENIRVDDLRECCLTLLNAYLESDESDDNFNFLLGIARRWLHAETLTQTERKQIRVFSRLATASVAIRFMREVLELARKLEIMEGLFLCIDEMESLTRRGLSQGQIQSFLQDLRYLYDESVHGDAGFSLLFLSASTTTGAEQLIKYNYPIYQRLGYEGDNALLLREIESVAEAIEFAGAYIEFFHSKWLEDKGRLARKTELQPRALLTPTEIQSAFKEVSTGKSTAPPGPLLDILYRRVQEKREPK